MSLSAIVIDMQMLKKMLLKHWLLVQKLEMWISEDCEVNDRNKNIVMVDRLSGEKNWWIRGIQVFYSIQSFAFVKVHQCFSNEQKNIIKVTL